MSISPEIITCISLLALGELVDFNNTYPRICGHTNSAWVAITSHCQKEPLILLGSQLLHTVRNSGSNGVHCNNPLRGCRWKNLILTSKFWKSDLILSFSQSKSIKNKKMLSHVQIKVKKTSVIKEYLNFLRAFAGNVCSEFEGKKYHQILVIYHEELYDYKTLTQFKVKSEFKGNCFLEPKLRSWIKILESK